MKKSILSILAVTALLTSCTKEEVTNVVDNGFVLDASNLKGEISNGEINLRGGQTYSLTGALVVKNGASLSIPAGTVIEATGGTASYIAVERGAKIYIDGEAGNPVIMTSGAAAPSQGDWGGLVICGDASTNLGADVLSEVAGLTYGGTDDADNSGSISYLRIEYTGAKFNASKEFNGISFFGVGSGTTVDNVYAYESGDDGIEFFGGAVNASNLAIVNAYDDSLDFADGYKGTINGLYIEGVTKAAIEGSNNGDDESKTPETNATITNVTVVKGDAAFGASENVINYKEGGGSQSYTNLVFTGFSKVAKYSGDAVTAGNVATKLNINSYYTDATVDTAFDEKGILTGVTNDGALTGAGNGTGEPTWLADLSSNF